MLHLFLPELTAYKTDAYYTMYSQQAGFERRQQNHQGMKRYQSLQNCTSSKFILGKQLLYIAVFLSTNTIPLL